MQVPVTCDGGLEDIDGSLPRAGFSKDEDHAYQRGNIPGSFALSSSLLYGSQSCEYGVEQNRLRLQDEHGHGRTAKCLLISHLLNMDDLKLYGRNPDQLDRLLHTVRTLSDDIQMKFGLGKYAIAHYVNGKLSGHITGVKLAKRRPSRVWNRVKSTSTWV